MALIQLSKNCARIIRVNDGSNRYTLYPNGPAVEVPDNVVTHISTRPHIESGDVIVLQSVTEPDDEPTLDKDALREQCALLGIDVKAQWSAKKMKAEIDKLAQGD